jgi:hypothetical protein
MRGVLITLAATAATGATAHADVVFGDFENGALPGWGWLTGDSRGIVAWDASLGPASGTIVAAPSGPLAGSQVLKMAGTATFNYGQSSGAVLGFDIAPQGFRSAFLEHDQIEFDWYAPPDANSTSGWSQIWNVILNSEAGGFANVDGYSQNNPGGTPPVDKSQFNQFYFTGFTGSLKHVVVDYTAYKNAILASGLPDGGGWLQLGMQLNAGGGAPGEMWFDNFKFSSSASSWNVDADGAWSTDANWSSAAHPNAAGKAVNFGPMITAPHIVTIDGAKTVGQLNFNNANKYTIGGTATLTLDAPATVGITVSNGSHDVTAPLALAKNLNVAVTAADSTLTLSDLQASAVSITKSGPGVLAVNNVRANALAVNEGTVAVLPDTTAAGVSNVGSLSIGASARLDLKRNKLVTNTEVGSFNGTAYTGVQGEVQRAYNFGAWDQPGLTTSEENAGQNAGPLSNTTTIAVATASQVMFIEPTDTAVFQGQTVTGATTIAMYTYAGDLNMDGLIDGADYGVIDNSVQFPGTDGYANGDFNYDGVIDGADYGIIDNAIQFQGAAFPGVVFGVASSSAGMGGVAAVPEPSACGLTLAGAAALLARRGRRAAHR